LAGDGRLLQREPGHVATWVGHASDKPTANRIGYRYENDWNRLRQTLEFGADAGAVRENAVGRRRDHFLGVVAHPRQVAVRVAKNNADVVRLRPPTPLQRLLKSAGATLHFCIIRQADDGGNAAWLWRILRRGPC